EVDGEEHRDLVEQRPRHAIDVGRPRELRGDTAHALELALAFLDRGAVTPGPLQPERRADGQTDEQRADRCREVLPGSGEADDGGAEQLGGTHTGGEDHTDSRARQTTVFSAANVSLTSCKDGPVGPLSPCRPPITV